MGSGQDFVSAGGTATSTVVEDGGREFLFISGTASGTTVITRDGEVVMGFLPHTRANLLKTGTNRQSQAVALLARSVAALPIPP